jgi:hypothetical protein
VAARGIPLAAVFLREKRGISEGEASNCGEAGAPAVAKRDKNVEHIETVFGSV